MDTTKDKVVHFIVENEVPNMSKLVDELIRKDVTAMTYFVEDTNGEELKANKDEIYSDIRDNVFGREFVYVLGLSNDGYIVRLKG